MIFEEKRYVGQSDGKDGKSTIKCYGKCEKQRYCHDMVEENLKQYLGDIENYCKKYEAEQGYRLSAQDENAKKDKIIEKMNDKYSLVFDKKFGSHKFNISSTYHLLFQLL